MKRAKQERKHLIIDLDNTLTIDNEAPYELKPINESVKNQLLEYKKLGFKISIFTSRNMRTYNNDIEKIKENSLPIIIEWLNKFKVPYDEVIIGKPWCGEEGFYVDDRAIRPSEFVNKTYEEIQELLKLESKKNKTINKPESNNKETKQ